MSEGSSSDDDWYASADSQHKGKGKVNCWECGQKFLSLDSLISHYKSHNARATCHICNVTFRRVTSLITHLNNVHATRSETSQWFQSPWEPNMHSEPQCLGSALSDSSPSFSYVSQQIENSDNFEMASYCTPKDVLPNDAFFSVANDHSYARSCDDMHIEQLTAQQGPDEESMPLESCDIKQERAETPDDTIDYTVRAPDDSCQTENTDDSSNAEQDAEMCLSDDSETLSASSTDTEGFPPDDLKSDCGSTSFGSSSDSFDFPQSKKTAATHHSADTSMCTACGKGPFRNVKVHWLHCTRKKVAVQCSVCKQHFPSEQSLGNHKLRLYSCDICGQVFRYWNSFNYHQCPKGSPSTVLFFCSKVMPKACTLCKAFFNSEQTLLNHYVSSHSTVVGTKVSFVAKPTASTDSKVLPIVSPSAAQSSISNSGHVLLLAPSLTSQRPSVVSQVINGKVSADQSHVESLSSLIKSRPPHLPSLSHQGLIPVSSRFVNGGTDKLKLLQGAPSAISQVDSEKDKSNLQVTVDLNNAESQPQMIPFHEMRSSGKSLLNAQTFAPCSPDRPPPAPSAAVGLGPNSAFDQTTNQLVSAINKTPATCSISSPVPSLSILAMFKNESQEVALMKRMNTSWRSKAPYPCRQCGAISRQPSIIISHRYLHRGRRSHHCQCGRTFKHRLHLLRHCVQHAEAVNYICVSCGETFVGARLFTEHMNGNLRKSRSSGCRWNYRMRKCQMPLTCDCGLLFVRPSAYIWHQLVNRTKVKQWKSPLK